MILREFLFFVALFFIMKLHLKQQWWRTNSKREIKLSLKVKEVVKEVWKGGEKRNCFRNNNLVDNWHNKINLVITFARLIKLV